MSQDVVESVPEPVQLRTARHILSEPGDIRNEVAFQNDVNALLAALSDGNPFRPVAPLFTTPRRLPPAAAPQAMRPRPYPPEVTDTDVEIPVFRAAVAT